MDTARVLIKIFSWRFYRENSGLLLFSYVSIISYCFFIKTAGVYPPEQSVFYHLMLMMTFIVSPAVMLIVFLLFLLYTIKSWRYVGKQLKHETNQFLYYSFCASSKTKQFGSLFLMQLVILLPLIGLALRYYFRNRLQSEPYSCNYILIHPNIRSHQQLDLPFSD